MFRKFLIATGAALALSAAALTPTAASAHGMHGHWHGHWGGPSIYPVYGGYGYGCYTIRKFVPTPFGLIKKRVVVCD